MSTEAKKAQAHNAEADKRTLQKKLAASERRVQGNRPLLRKVA